MSANTPKRVRVHAVRPVKSTKNRLPAAGCSAKTVREARARARVKHTPPQPDLIDIRNRLEIIYAAAVTVSLALAVSNTENSLNFSPTLRFAVLDPLFDVMEKFDVLLLQHDSKVTP